MLNFKIFKYFLIVLITCCVVGCASQQAVPGAFSTPKRTPILMGIGAAGGAIAAGATGAASIPVGAVVGGALGGVAGLYTDSAPGLASKLKEQGVQVVQLGDEMRIIMPSDPLFDLGTANLSDQSGPILGNVGAFLKRYGNVPMNIQGYTDDVWGVDKAASLSRLQADAVVGYLWAHGIPFRQLTAYGCGESCTIASNRTVYGSTFNRRIEITFRK